MIYPEADKLENWGSKYGLVVLAAKRAKQLKSGAPPMINTDSRNPLTIALEEIAAGKIMCDIADTDALLAVAQEPEVAQLLAIPERMDEELEPEIETNETPVIVDDSASQEVLEKEEETHEDWETHDEVEEEEEEDELAFHDDEEDDDLVVGLDPNVEDLSIIPSTEEAKPKTRGRRKATPVEPDQDVDHDLDIPDVDIDMDADIEIDLDSEDEDKEEAEEEG